jgi:hypothetical protein
VLTLVNREGEARSFHIDQANGETIVPIVRANVIKEAKIATDQAAYYGGYGGRRETLHRYLAEFDFRYSNRSALCWAWRTLSAPRRRPPAPSPAVRTIFRSHSRGNG